MKELSKKLKLKRTWQLHVMMVPIVVLLVIFCYVPMIGIVVSFQDYLPTKGFFGSPWVGLDNYRFLFSLNDFFQIIRNTLIISGGKILLGLIISIFFAIMLYESNMRIMKNVVQTSVFLPYFLSWVVLGGIFIDIFSLEGVVNRIISFLGIEPVMFMGHPIWFVIVIIITDVWKVYGYNMIVFYAAIMGIDTALYESATIDGAGRIRQVFAITLPSIAPMIVVMGMLSLGNILNAGFDQIFNMYNPTVMSTADILDTYIYRMGVVSGQYSFATAVGFFKSIVAMILIVTSNWAAKRFAGYRIF
ncbi:MAG: ABC transporter permease subunit [Caldicoprobacterales bacterium]